MIGETDNGAVPVLRRFEGVPDGFLDADAAGLAGLLGGPALIELPGERSRPLCVAILLHGNEITGLAAVQRLLRHYRGRALPRALALFVGNVAAAAAGMRRLPEQPDYNRIWPRAPGGGPAVAPCAETDLARTVHAALAARHPFAVVDVHNNNGRNPHYACVNVLDAGSLRLAAGFGRRVLYFIDPEGTFGGAFAGAAPAVTLECGRPGEAAGTAHAAVYLERLMHLADLAHSVPGPDEIDLHRSAVRLHVPEAVSVAVGPGRAQLLLRPDLEALNWVPQPAGTPLGRIAVPAGDPALTALAPGGTDATGAYLRRRGDAIVLSRSATPAMFTTNLRMIRLDCLGYLLERIAL